MLFLFNSDLYKMKKISLPSDFEKVSVSNFYADVLSTKTSCSSARNKNNMEEKYDNRKISMTPSLEWEEESDAGSSSSLSSIDSTDSLSSRVSWSPKLVDKVHYRPVLSHHEKDKLFYTCSDYIIFRRLYKEHLIHASMERKRRKTRELVEVLQKDEPQDNITTQDEFLIAPLTWLVNSVYNFFWSLESSSGVKNDVQETGRMQRAIPPIVEVELLVDTMYLF